MGLVSAVATGLEGLDAPHAAIPTRVDVDAPLVGALRRRDLSAAEWLVARFGHRAYRLAFGITRSAEDAEEVVQDAFWSVIQKIDTFRGDSAFRSWMYRIIANAAYQKVRARSRRRAEISLDDVLPSFDEHGQHAETIVDWSARLGDVSTQTDLRAALSSAIGQLPPDYRAAVVLRDVEGLSTPEIAESLRISVGGAKARVHRGRLLLRKRLASFMAKTTAPRESHGKPESGDHG